MKIFVLLAAPLLLVGCISFHSSETPAPQDASASVCANKDVECRELCGNVGVQAFSCNARPGEGIHLRCECRKPGQAI